MDISFDQIVDRAADIIERDGLVAGRFHQHNGVVDSLTSPNRQCSHCAVGAMVQAYSDLTGEVQDLASMWNDLAGCFLIAHVDGENVTEWSDDLARSGRADKVVAALREGKVSLR